MNANTGGPGDRRRNHWSLLRTRTTVEQTREAQRCAVRRTNPEDPDLQIRLGAILLLTVLELLIQRSRLGAFERALSLAVFGFLKQHKTRSEERFADVAWSLENLVARYVNVSVAALFLTAGVDYLKRGDTKALMRLSREERALFTKELGIDAFPATL